jgi:hypothetical protein
MGFNSGFKGLNKARSKFSEKSIVHPVYGITPQTRKNYVYKNIFKKCHAPPIPEDGSHKTTAGCLTTLYVGEYLDS